jgi:hypothetical protein
VELSEKSAKASLFCHSTLQWVAAGRLKARIHRWMRLASGCSSQLEFVEQQWEVWEKFDDTPSTIFPRMSAFGSDPS